MLCIKFNLNLFIMYCVVFFNEELSVAATTVDFYEDLSN